MKHERWIELVTVVIIKCTLISFGKDRWKTGSIHSIAPGTHQRVVAIFLLFKMFKEKCLFLYLWQKLKFCLQEFSGAAEKLSARSEAVWAGLDGVGATCKSMGIDCFWEISISSSKGSSNETRLAVACLELMRCPTGVIGFDDVTCIAAVCMDALSSAKAGHGSWFCLLAASHSAAESICIPGSTTVRPCWSAVEEDSSTAAEIVSMAPEHWQVRQRKDTKNQFSYNRWRNHSIMPSASHAIQAGCTRSNACCLCVSGVKCFQLFHLVR